VSQSDVINVRARACRVLASAAAAAAINHTTPKHIAAAAAAAAGADVIARPRAIA